MEKKSSNHYAENPYPSDQCASLPRHLVISDPVTCSLHFNDRAQQARADSSQALLGQASALPGGMNGVLGVHAAQREVTKVTLGLL